MIIISEQIEISIDAEDLLHDLEEVDRKVEQTEANANEVIAEVEESTRSAFTQTLNMARNAYTIGLGIVKATGVSVSYFFRSMMSAAFGAISILRPLLTAEAVTPGMQAQAIIGFAELAVAIAAVVAAQLEQSEIARGFRGAAMAISGIQSLIGGQYYL